MTYVTVADFIKIIKAPFFVRGDGTKVIETAQINNEQLSQSQLIQQGEIEAEQERQRQEAIRKQSQEVLQQGLSNEMEGVTVQGQGGSMDLDLTPKGGVELLTG